MRVKLSDIDGEGLRIVAFRKPEWVTNVPELTSAANDTRLSSNLKFDLMLTKILREITVIGNVSFLIESVCARCLEDVELELSPEVKLVLSPLGADQEKDEDIESETYTGDEFDLGVYLREVIAMSLPVKVLCGERCRGICSSCGADLNRGTCSCRDKRIDPRFAVLRNVKI